VILEQVLKVGLSWKWWYMPVIPAFGRHRQEDREVEAIGRLCLKNQNKKVELNLPGCRAWEKKKTFCTKEIECKSQGEMNIT
jgi:hypothetical protein